MAAINITGIPLKDQRIAVLGAGSAGSGIGLLLLRAMVEAGLSDDEAKSHFYAVDRNGLLVEGMTGILPFQEPFVQRRAAIADWTLHQPDKIDLLDVVVNARPTVLIGVSGQPGVFSEAVVRAMARNVERPVIFPLSNPTSRSEASPTDLLAWTDGRAIIGTGSPFPPVERSGRHIQIDQTNNSYIFPGIGLGVIASRATYISDAMFMASARALAETSPARLNPEANLLPSVDSMREVSLLVALAVARQAQLEGVAEPCEEGILEARIRALIWEPQYVSYRRRSFPSELNALS
jgi:malate dehydrogenase (oxaloacetate-decarboxylating)